MSVLRCVPTAHCAATNSACCCCNNSVSFFVCMWVSCNVTAGPGQGSSSDLHAKALLRRAEAHMGLAQYHPALQVVLQEPAWWPVLVTARQIHNHARQSCFLQALHSRLQPEVHSRLVHNQLLMYCCRTVFAGEVSAEFPHIQLACLPFRGFLQALTRCSLPDTRQTWLPVGKIAAK
jgi:hypothetical protein